MKEPGGSRVSDGRVLQRVVPPPSNGNAKTSVCISLLAVSDKRANVPQAGFAANTESLSFSST